MSGNIGGQVRTLPFTGLTMWPLLALGVAVSGAGFLMTKVRSTQADHKK